MIDVAKSWRLALGRLKDMKVRRIRSRLAVFYGVKRLTSSSPTSWHLDKHVYIDAL